MLCVHRLSSFCDLVEFSKPRLFCKNEGSVGTLGKLSPNPYKHRIKNWMKKQANNHDNLTDNQPNMKPRSLNKLIERSMYCWMHF